MSPQLSRRSVLFGAAGSLLVPAALASCSSSDEQGDPDTVVVSTFPFGVEEFTKAVVDPFTEETGVKVKIETGSNADRLSKLQLEKGKGGIDVMLISDTYAALAEADDLFQKVSADDVPNLKKIAPFAVEENYSGPAYSYQVNGAMFRTDKLDADKAAGWDLYSDSSLSGKLVLPDIAVTAGQLTVSGVGETFGSGPYDVDAAFETMAQWAPNILQFYSSTTEFTNLLTQGEVYAGISINAFATELVAAGEPIGWAPPESGRYMATNRAMVPAGAPNASGAHKFIDFLLSKVAQQKSSELVGDLPVNLAVDVPKKLTDVVGDIAKDPEAAGYKTLDPAQIAPNRKEWVERFAREVVGA